MVGTFGDNNHLMTQQEGNIKNPDYRKCLYSVKDEFSEIFCICNETEMVYVAWLSNHASSLLYHHCKSLNPFKKINIGFYGKFDAIYDTQQLDDIFLILTEKMESNQ